MNSVKQLVFILWASKNAIRRLRVITHKNCSTQRKKMRATDRISKDQTEQGEGKFILIDTLQQQYLFISFFRIT